MLFLIIMKLHHSSVLFTAMLELESLRDFLDYFFTDNDSHTFFKGVLFYIFFTKMSCRASWDFVQVSPTSCLHAPF